MQNIFKNISVAVLLNAPTLSCTLKPPFSDADYTFIIYRYSDYYI